MENQGTKEYKRIERVDTDCFACGRDNPHGLHMRFETNGENLRSSITVPCHMRGWSNLVHGGILSTICDEIMSWSAIYLTRRFILTKSLSLTFLKPVFIDREIMARGFIKERVDERNAVVGAEILDKNGEICTRARGEFALFTPEDFRKFKIMPDELIDEMSASFETD
ncbi:PaaI family thioesterase [Desulfospira joergensenii]|uniref:PaaI family thioesterase n=1 Tax=Desulfospira joergensenii TaxID=53329 RepID=UPI0003B574C7|nr:PaaI family thioesterase [Desulfospira joergensenii]